MLRTITSVAHFGATCYLLYCLADLYFEVRTLKIQTELIPSNTDYDLEMMNLVAKNAKSREEHDQSTDDLVDELKFLLDI